MAGLILKNETSLIDADLSAAYQAYPLVKEVTAMFRKKEDINKMSKSVLKHRIQTLTGRNIQIIQDEMKYKPVDPNETGMNHDIMKKLAHCLILLAEGQLKENNRTEAPGGATNGTAESIQPTASKKRMADDMSPAVEQQPKAKKGRKSIATLQIAAETKTDSPRAGRASRKSVGPIMMSTTPTRGSRRLNDSSDTEASVAVRCLAPNKTNADKIKEVEEESEDVEEEQIGISNPTPAMKELIKKRRSIAGAKETSVKTKSPKKKEEVVAVAEKKVVKKNVTIIPRTEFMGTANSRSYLIAGDVLKVGLDTIQRIIPLSVRFPGAHLAVVHTPIHWSPPDVFRMAQTIRTLNLSAGLDNFVILIGTGFRNLKMNTEALETITKHVQFITFHREDAHKDELPTGKLRETTSLFLVAYIFPGCEKEGSPLPSRMVADGYTTCFRCDNVAHLEESIIDCFSEKGEWLLDLFPERRKLTLAAQQAGRNAVVISPEVEDLEFLGSYLRTLSMREDDSYRDVDGLVTQI